MSGFARQTQSCDRLCITIAFTSTPSKMCIFFLITLGLATTAAGAPQDCTEHCKSLSLEEQSLQSCRCFSAKLKEAVTSASDLPILSDSTKRDETEIYYEPDQTFTLQTKMNFQQPFYITNPNSKQKIKTPKRHVENKNSFELRNQYPKEVNNILISPKPLYLDIVLEDDSMTRDTRELEDVELTENILSECLDLHFIVYARKGANIPITRQYIQPVSLEKYKSVSDAEILNTIERKCRQPLEIINKTLNKIQISQPKIKKPTLNNTQLLNSDSGEALVDPYLNEYRGANPLLDIKREIYKDEYSILHNLTYSNSTSMHKESKHIKSYTDLKRTPHSRNESDLDYSSSENKFVSTRSTLSLSNTGTLNMPITRSRDIQEDNVISSTYNETIDTDMTSPVNEIFTNVYEEKDSSTESMTVIDATLKPIDYYHTDGSLYDSNNFTREADFVFDTTDNKPMEFIAESMTNESTPESERGSISETSSSEIETTTEIQLKQTLQSASSQLFYSNDNTEKYHKKRQKYKESEVLIPKIFTKELANGSIVSNVQGYEILPNGDFTVNIDDISDEYSNNERSAQFASRQVSAPKHSPPDQTGITGKIYFIFDRALIPARFLQNSDGIVSLGIDGKPLCQNILNNSTNSSQFLLKLCKAVISDSLRSLR